MELARDFTINKTHFGDLPEYFKELRADGIKGIIILVSFLRIVKICHSCSYHIWFKVKPSYYVDNASLYGKIQVLKWVYNLSECLQSLILLQLIPGYVAVCCFISCCQFSSRIRVWRSMIRTLHMWKGRSPIFTSNGQVVTSCPLGITKSTITQTWWDL